MLPWNDKTRPNPADKMDLYDVEKEARSASGFASYLDRVHKAPKGGGWGGGDNPQSTIFTHCEYYLQRNELILSLRQIETPLERAFYYAWFTRPALGTGGWGGLFVDWFLKEEGMVLRRGEFAEPYAELKKRHRPEQIVHIDRITEEIPYDRFPEFDLVGPCYRQYDVYSPGWQCVFDHTVCAWNNGNNSCLHEGYDNQPLEE